VRTEKVVVGGSGNCLMEHGNENDRGFRPERKVAVRRDRVRGREVAYHMTEPRRISMCERRELVDNVVVVLNEAQTVFSCADVNMTMFPRLMTECWCVSHDA
jgi:hypothetical protein